MDEYVMQNGVDHWTMDEIAEWAINTGRYQRPPISTLQQCKRDLSRAAQQAFYTDPQGREIRRLHAVRLPGEGGSAVIWADINNAKPTHMHMSLQQGRQAIVADAHRHKLTVESYNDNNKFGAQIPLFDYNLNLDLDELDRPTEYPDNPPEN